MTLASLLAGVAVLAWLVAAVAALRLMRYRLPGRSAGWYAVRGHAFFSAASFSPDGAATHRTFLLAALGFGVALVALILVTLLNLPR
jgi:hypothetical protein